MEVGGIFKTNIEMALTSGRYINDLDHVTLSFGFFSSHSEQFNGKVITPAFRVYLHSCQKHTPKSRKLSVAHNLSCWNGPLVVPWSAIYSVYSVCLFYSLFPISISISRTEVVLDYQIPI